MKRFFLRGLLTLVMSALVTNCSHDPKEKAQAKSPETSTNTFKANLGFSGASLEPKYNQTSIALVSILKYRSNNEEKNILNILGSWGGAKSFTLSKDLGTNITLSQTSGVIRNERDFFYGFSFTFEVMSGDVKLPFLVSVNQHSGISLTPLIPIEDKLIDSRDW